MSRTENDRIGPIEIADDCLHGAQTQRALENFDIAGQGVHPALIHAFGEVKLAAARTNHHLGLWSQDPQKANAIFVACEELAEGGLDHTIVVDALQGGAGTSTNFNVNEVIANRALQLLELPPNHERVSPLQDINRHQSTNDTFPTALRIAAIRLLQELEESLIATQQAFQELEQRFAAVIKLGRTQLQDAVMTTLGREMAAYAEAISRDRWRIYKCQERLRVINLGGTAIGTGLTAPRQYIFKVVDELRSITGLGLARAEDLVEATQNTDALVEVSGILKAHASSLLKIANDLRLLGSGPHGGLAEIALPPRQDGSTIMPDKVNPVIPEAVAQTAMLVFGYDHSLTIACSLGNLELNPFLPLVAKCLLGSIEMLSRANKTLTKHCLLGIQANEERCADLATHSNALATALVNVIGKKRAEEIAHIARESGLSVYQVALREGVLPEDELARVLSPEQVCQLGDPKLILK